MRYIIHDAVAHEVDRETFFHTRESGGTIISSAYKLLLKIIEEQLHPERLEHLPVPVLRRRQLVGRRHRGVHASCSDEQILPISQSLLLRAGGERLRQRPVHQGPGGPLSDHETLITSQIPNRDAIVESIKKFLGKGK